MKDPFAKLPKHHFGVIYVDPPWRFITYSDKGKASRSAELHYQTMAFKDICALRAQDLAAENCVLILWVTDPFLPKGLRLMRAWGFKYKTVAFHWVKLDRNKQGRFDFFMSTGYWTRKNPEIAILGTIGHPKRLAKNVNALVVSSRREHSRKPDRIPNDIERLVGGPYLELFGRGPREGWTVWGNEKTKFTDRSIVKPGKEEKPWTCRII